MIRNVKFREQTFILATFYHDFHLLLFLIIVDNRDFHLLLYFNACFVQDVISGQWESSLLHNPHQPNKSPVGLSLSLGLTDGARINVTLYRSYYLITTLRVSLLEGAMRRRK